MPLYQEAITWINTLNPRQIHDYFQRVFGKEPFQMNNYQLCMLYVRITGNVKIRKLNDD